METLDKLSEIYNDLNRKQMRRVNIGLIVVPFLALMGVQHLGIMTVEAIQKLV